jgi:NTE family protein
MSKNVEKTVSLVLGSGGARGLAHIGVIRWLEDNHFKIESISGCSMGALVGGIYAAGKLEDFENWARAITKVDIVTLLDVSWNKSGLVKGDKLFNTLRELVGDVDIEDLPVTFTAVATDIQVEKEIWVSSGKLFDAIRASISLPLFFTPFRYKGVDLIDGGVLNPVPIAPTFNDDTDLTVAVNLGGKVDNKKKITINNDSASENKSPFTRKITEFVKSLKDSTAKDISKDWDAYDIANQAFDAMQSTIARQKLAAYPADHLIEIPRNACRTLEFDLASEMIELGYKSAQKTLGKVTR